MDTWQDVPRAQYALADIETLLGPQSVRRAAQVDAIHPGWDPLNLAAGAMALPSSTDEVAEIVKICAHNGVSLVAQGGRTGLVGGSISRPGQIVLSLERMNRIERIYPDERIAVVEAGATLQRLQDAAAEFGLEPGVDIASRASATLGGMASTNAGGKLAFRRGVMRQQIFGLEAVLPDGEIFSDLTRVVKVAAGYDIKQLFIGAEGTLGVITRLAIKLERQPEATVTALFALPSFGAGQMAIDLGRERQSLRVAEFMARRFLLINAEAQEFSSSSIDFQQPLYLLVCYAGAQENELRELAEHTYIKLNERFPEVSGVVADGAFRAEQLWRLREDTDTVYRRYPEAPSFDVSVPISAIEDYVARVEDDSAKLGFEPFIFGHLADGNLHIIFNHVGAFPPALGERVEDILYRGLHRLGGSFSAEHGVGSKRIAALNSTVDASKLKLMVAVKRALDPQNLMNPGKVVALG